MGERVGQMSGMNAKMEELVSKYIRKTENAFKELKTVQGLICPDSNRVQKVIEEAKRYLEDAKYYLDGKRFETSLASVAYCEGLLDTLRMLGFVQFSWQVN
jgi:FAD synthetase